MGRASGGLRLAGIAGRHHPRLWCALEKLHHHAWRLGGRRRSLLSTAKTDGALDPGADVL
jgi:hypothetical protein